MSLHVSQTWNWTQPSSLNVQFSSISLHLRHRHIPQRRELYWWISTRHLRQRIHGSRLRICQFCLYTYTHTFCALRALKLRSEQRKGWRECWTNSTKIPHYIADSMLVPHAWCMFVRAQRKTWARFINTLRFHFSPSSSRCRSGTMMMIEIPTVARQHRLNKASSRSFHESGKLRFSLVFIESLSLFAFNRWIFPHLITFSPSMLSQQIWKSHKLWVDSSNERDFLTCQIQSICESKRYHYVYLCENDEWWNLKGRTKI